MTDIILAHDGSSHCGWVGRYAVRLAANAPGRLVLLHVDETNDDAASVDEALIHLQRVAVAAGVDAEVRRVQPEPNVPSAIETFLRTHQGALLVLGLRAREDGRGLLAGTVSEALLQRARNDVLAIRVTSPGQLGHAAHILYALSQNPNSARKGRQFLRLLQPERLSLLTVVPPALGRLASPTAADLRRLSAMGRTFLKGVETELRKDFADTPIDATVHVDAEWTGEVIRHASRVDAQLLLLGATERSLPRRIVFGNPLERVLHDATCDVAVFRLGGPR